VATGVPGDRFDQRLHLAQHPLARPERILLAPRMSHLDAELVHLPGKLLWLAGPPPKQPRFAEYI
jgi:hypothetical protein